MRMAQWRFDTGYQSAPDSPPSPPAIQYYIQAAPPQTYFIPGPVGINGIFTQPPPAANLLINFPPPPPAQEAPPTAPRHPVAVPPPPPPSVKKEPPPKKGDDKKSEPPKKAEKPAKVNPYAPPELKPGMNYWFPWDHVILHIFDKACKMWEDKYKDDKKSFKSFKVDTLWPVWAVIERTMCATSEEAAERCKGWAVTEVIERGDNTFSKGTTIEYGSDKANGTLASMAWNGKRGKSLPPVWLTVHKV